MKKILSILGLSLVLTGCSITPSDQSDNQTETNSPTAEVNEQTEPVQPDNPTENNQPGTIAEVATQAGSFNTLLTAVEAAGLTETLNGNQMLTVFAPTDEAFAKLPDGTVEALLGDPDQLTAILTYHVVAGTVTSDQVTNLSSTTTLQGSELSISVDNQQVKINDATVVQADIPASNGVIHVIDTVLIPE